MNYKTPDKKTHYKLIKTYFTNDAYIRKDFYTTNKKSTIQKQINKRQMWKKYIKIIDTIFQENKDITSVTDAGCGMGHLITELILRKQLKQINGIDFLRETLKLARENIDFKNVNLIEADITTIPFKNQITDITICLNTLHHIHKEDIEKTINELARITKKYLILEIRNKDCKYNIFYRLLNSLVYQKLPINVSSKKQIEDILKKQNLKLTEIATDKKQISKSRRIILTFKKT